MESLGLISPAVSVDVNYKKSTTYDDIISITVKIKELSMSKIKFEYEMRVDKNIVCLATSVHCFVDENGRPISVKKACPELFDLLSSLVENN